MFIVISRGVSVVSSHALADYTRWVLWLPVLIGLGIGIYFSLPVEPSIWVGLSATVVFITLTCRWRTKPGIFQLVLALCFVSLGFLASQFRTSSVDSLTLAREVGPTSVQGRVLLVEPKTTGARLVLDKVTAERLTPYETPERIRITSRFDTAKSVSPGDWIELTAVLRPPSAPTTPGAFDFQRHAFFHQIGATGYSYNPPKVIQHWKTSTRDMVTWLARIRLATGNKVRGTLQGETGAIAAALITGEKQAIPKPAVTAMRNAGLAHLLAISGLHIGLVTGLVFFVVRAGLALIPRVALHQPIKTWAALVALGAAFGYTLLAGATIPTLRSFLMMALVLGAVMVGRRAISMRSVAVAATIVLLFRPDALLGPSFQLSFAAVIGLVAVYEWISEKAPRLWSGGSRVRRMSAYFVGVALSTLIAGSATAPFAAYHFHQLAGFGMIANLVAVPLTALCIMPSALAVMALMPFGLEHLPLYVMGLGVDGLLVTARAVASLPGNLLFFPTIPVPALIVITLGGLWLCLWQKNWRLIGAAIIAGGIGMASGVGPPLVQVSENAQVFAIHTPTEFAIVGPGVRGNRYTKSAWLERAGYGRGARASTYVLSSETTNSDRAIRCDHMGCIIALANTETISVVWDEGALLEECWRKGVLVSAVPVRRRCDVPTHVIDRFDIWRNGAYAIYTDGKGVRIENTRTSRGDRPWTRAANRAPSRTRDLGS